MKVKNLLNIKFGKLLVINKAASDERNRTRWLCKCDCGNEKIILAAYLLCGDTKSCGCLGKLPKIDLKGKIFDRLTIIEHIEKRNWLCKCICGNTCISSEYDLMRKNKNKKKRSCGCLLKDSTRILGKRKRKLKYNKDIYAAMLIWKDRYNDGNISFKQFLKLASNKCFYCKRKPFKVFTLKRTPGYNPFIYNGLDRVDNSKPHNFDNVVTCCIDCNWAKNNLSLSTFLNWLNRISDNLINLENWLQFKT